MNMSKGSEREDFEWAVKLQRTSLDIIGLWPKVDHKRKEFRTNLLVLLEFAFILFLCVVPAFHALLKNFSDIEAVIDNLQFFIPLIITLLKLAVISYKRKSLIPAIDMIAYDWSKPKSNSERLVMIRQSQIARTITVCSYVLMIFCVLMLLCLPGFGIRLRYLTNSTDFGRILPLQTYYVFDVTKSPNYELTFAVQCIGIVIGATCITAVDNFLGLLVFHISGQMENLRVRFAHMIDAMDFDKTLAYNVKEHIRLVRLVEIVENSFTLLLLGVLLFFATFFCVYGTLLINICNQGTNMSILRGGYLFIILLNIFIHMCICFVVGEILVNDSEGIYNTICECEWEKLEPKNARSMILLMIRTKKSLYLTAGKIAPMTIPTFSSILKMSVSYISLLITKLD